MHSNKPAKLKVENSAQEISSLSPVSFRAPRNIKSVSISLATVSKEFVTVACVFVAVACVFVAVACVFAIKFRQCKRRLTPYRSKDEDWTQYYKTFFIRKLRILVIS
jgi:hypothetical protein